MRFEDNMMPILTGLVFAVVVGTTAQNSDDLLTLFGADTQIQADDDVFFVRAGTKATLDVLANDNTGVEQSDANIQIVSGPACGDVAPTLNGINYLNSGGCEGPVSFTYCLGEGETCEAADVTMNVRPAPVAVADAYLPEKGNLVPLPLSQISNTGTAQKHRPAADQGTQLNAFVVTIAPQKAEVFSTITAISKYMINAQVADLNKMPSSDPSQYVSLRSVDVPLSAVRTARFLTSYDAETPSVAENALIELDGAKALIEEIEVKDETAQIDLEAPVLLDNTQG